MISNNELIEMAIDAMKNSYSPYSKFSVGAALLTKDGTVFKGCNIENSSFGATLCAERVAVGKAISEGYRDFEKIAIVGSAGEHTLPCGICRQVLGEFMYNGTVLTKDKKSGEIIEHKMKELLPGYFIL